MSIQNLNVFQMQCDTCKRMFYDDTMWAMRLRSRKAIIDQAELHGWAIEGKDDDETVECPKCKPARKENSDGTQKTTRDEQHEDS